MQQRAILFVDGENLTMRYQEMLAAGMKPRDGVEHLQDTFAWHGRVTHVMYAGLPSVARVYYYTSVVGDEAKVDEVRSRLAKISYASKVPDGYHNAQLVPVVFKKPRKSVKTRNVDIQIVIDVMRFSLSKSIDRVYLASGDGDYFPLVQEVMRSGTQLELLAFSSGLNPRLISAVDRLHTLDSIFFKGID